MPTVIQNDGNADGGNGMGNLLAVVLLIIAVFGFIYYGLPALRNATTPSVNVPEKINVDVNQK
ncbi:MAG: hypothetical protein RI947_485 [Candidatus Parcubacteria bacterium]|jgi:hypothetical protein